MLRLGADRHIDAFRLAVPDIVAAIADRVELSPSISTSTVPVAGTMQVS